MATTAKIYAKALLSAFAKKIDISADTLKVALFTSSLTITQATDQFFDAAPYTSNQVAAGNGYATGGATIATPTAATSGLTLTIDGADASWAVTGAGFTYRYAVIYDDTPASNKPLLAYVDFGADQTAAEGTHALAWAATGILALTVA